MVFGRKKDTPDSEDLIPDPAAAVESSPTLVVLAPEEIIHTGFYEQLASAVRPLESVISDTEEIDSKLIQRSTGVLAVFQSPEILDKLLDEVIISRKRRDDGTPYLIIATEIKKLGEFGAWLHERALADRLNGIRLIAANSAKEVTQALPDKIEPIKESCVLRMPISPEIEDTEYKYFFSISPNLRSVVKSTRELAENAITRIYLLGGPGSGKTSLAYYYYLCRGKGNFVAINLNAESTGDKAAMKSLLCGHVTGAFPGANSREGAFSFAREGVCFLDESHGVTGVVMQVLMEALDSGQYLPFGATKKRAVECAVIFASNRSWEALRAMVNLDEHARLGATIIGLQDLSERREDLIAVAAATLAKFSSQCTTWTPPKGFSEEAWTALLNCPWHGNVRTLMRVIESAAVEFCSKNTGAELIDHHSVKQALELWEPEEHESLALYASVK